MMVFTKTKRAMAALAFMAALSMIAVPAMAAPAYSEVSHQGYINFVGTGSASYNYTFYVEKPYALGLDAAYWNITIYSDHTGTVATNASYYVHVHIYDGATNLTKNVTVAAKNDVRVYSNASHAHTAYAAMVTNASARYYVELILGGTSTVLAHYSGTVELTPYEGVATAVNLMYAIVPIVIIVAILNYITGSVKMKKK
jgi:hypothetical protein